MKDQTSSHSSNNLASLNFCVPLVPLIPHLFNSPPVNHFCSVAFLLDL